MNKPISIKDNTSKKTQKLFSLNPIDIFTTPEIENKYGPAPTPAAMNINEVYGDICQQECEFFFFIHLGYSYNSIFISVFLHH